VASPLATLGSQFRTMVSVLRLGSVLVEPSWLHLSEGEPAGYDAFSYLHSYIERVYNCILNQEAHHKIKHSGEGIFKKNEIEYNEKYSFKWYNWLLIAFIQI